MTHGLRKSQGHWIVHKTKRRLEHNDFTRLQKFKIKKRHITADAAIIIVMGQLQSASCCLLVCVAVCLCVYVQVSFVSTLLSPFYLMNSYKCKINITAVRRKNLQNVNLTAGVGPFKVVILEIFTVSNPVLDIINDQHLFSCHSVYCLHVSASLGGEKQMQGKFGMKENSGLEVFCLYVCVGWWVSN